ncbi:MAG: DUF5667 domain-containing protein [Anaerolineales bacterium]|nr:DUF5667 domain-containing protein [Anaerolineales bacterium]
MNEHEINPKLKKYLDSLKETPERDQEQAAETRAKFLARAESITPPQRTPARDKKWFQFPGKAWASRKWAPALAGILAALILALASVGGTVYAAQDSLPNDFLYPVKTLTETIQLKLEDDLEDRLDLHTHFAKRRLEEIQMMLENNEEIPPSALVRLETQTQKMLQEAAHIETQARQKALLQIQYNLQEQSLVLSQGNQGELGDVRERVQKQLEVVAEGIRNPGFYPEGLKNLSETPGAPPAFENPGQAGQDNGEKPDIPTDDPDQKPEHPGEKQPGPPDQIPGGGNPSDQVPGLENIPGAGPGGKP